MYQISKELALECNYDFIKKDSNGNIKVIEEKRNVFDNYKKEQVKKLTELLKVKGIEKSAIKKDREFAIPIESKEYIKYLILNYTSKPVKEIRKNGLESLPFSKWSFLLDGLVEYSTKDIKDSSEKEKKRYEILSQHQYFSIERHNHLIDKFGRLLKEAEVRYGSFENLGSEDINLRKQEICVMGQSGEETYDLDDDGTVRLLSENDVIELYGYLEKKIYQCFVEFGKVADIFSDIRHNEIEDKCIEAISENKNPRNINYDDSDYVMEEALKEFQIKYNK